MFESQSKLAEEISDLLLVVREVATGRYACLVEPEKTLFENPSEGGHDLAALQAFLEDRRSALFSLPSAMASGEPMEDVFAGWDRDEFFLAFLNGDQSGPALNIAGRMRPDNECFVDKFPRRVLGRGIRHRREDRHCQQRRQGNRFLLHVSLRSSIRGVPAQLRRA